MFLGRHLKYCFQHNIEFCQGSVNLLEAQCPCPLPACNPLRNSLNFQQFSLNRFTFEVIFKKQNKSLKNCIAFLLHNYSYPLTLLFPYLSLLRQLLEQSWMGVFLSQQRHFLQGSSLLSGNNICTFLSGSRFKYFRSVECRFF